MPAEPTGPSRAPDSDHPPGPRRSPEDPLGDPAGGLDRWPRVALAAALLTWAVLSLASVPLITLGTDEAWVLLGMRCWLEPAREDYTIAAIHTNGGLHAAANVLIERVVGNRVWAHRLFSWACLMALAGLVWSLGRRAGGSAEAGLVAVAPLIGLPGLAENFSSALGTSSGVLLLVLATWIWGRRGGGGRGAVIGCGILYGLAAACRFELILAVPAVVLAGSVAIRAGGGGPGLRPRLRAPVAGLGVAAIASAVLAANFEAHGAVTPEQVADGHTLEATGLVGLADLGGPKLLIRLIDYPRLLNRVKLAQQFGPLPALALASLVPLALGMAGDGRSALLARPTGLLVLIGWALWAGWMLRAPISHLRYLLPALACFAVAGGLGLARLVGMAREAGRRPARAALLLLATALVLGGAGPTFRSVVHGQHDLQSFEWAGWQGLEPFRRFQHARDQREVIAFLGEHAPDGIELLSISHPFILRYLLDRPVVHSALPGPGVEAPRGPALLVLTPPVRHLGEDPWVREHCRPVARFGFYTVLELPAPPPPDRPAP